MPRQALQPEGMAVPKPPYSPVVVSGDIVYTAGQIANDPEGNLVAGGIAEQARRTLENVRACVEAAGCTLDDVCKTTVWLQDARDFGSFNRIYMGYFGEKKPARSTTEARLMVDARLEIDVVAYSPRA